MVLYESPRRVLATLRDLAAACGPDRPVALARELTKLHEEVLRGRASEVMATLTDRTVKGELAVVIEGAPDAEGDLAEALAEAQDLVANGARKREAAHAAADHHLAPANDVYRALLD